MKKLAIILLVVMVFVAGLYFGRNIILKKALVNGKKRMLCKPPPLN